MKIRKDLGIACIILGILLTMDQTKDYQGIVEAMKYYFETYWPLLITFVGIYLLSNPVKKKK